MRGDIVARIAIAHIVVTLCSCDRSATPAAKTDLTAARAGHQTKLTHRGPSPQPYGFDRTPRDVLTHPFTSGRIPLKAWITADPQDGKKHAAVVYVHGGFAFGKPDFDETQPYRDAGFVVMTPTLRGENGNPGDFEWFYGEVDDVIAAGRYLASLPYVDPKKIYLAGHSSGGAITILVAVCANQPYAAATPIGGYVTMDEFAKHGAATRVMPFDTGDATEMRLRSAIHYAAFQSCPVMFFVGEDDKPAHLQLDDYISRATRAGHECEKVEIGGTHLTSRFEAIKRSADYFRQKAGI
jgi:dipeptidyl aminopeptidase/acylaminoacyl peptidase